MLTEGFYLLVDKRRPLRRRRAFFVLPAGRCFLRRWCALPSSAIVVFVIVVVSCRRLAKPVRTITVGFGSQAENPYKEEILTEWIRVMGCRGIPMTATIIADYVG